MKHNFLSVFGLSILFAGQALAQDSNVSSVHKKYNDINSNVNYDWYNKDFGKDGVVGVSSDKAYAELLQGKTGKKIVVAIIDSGVDTEHEDLKDKIWTNTDEIPNNNIDDDNNGYVDDVHGWNFLGNADGKMIDETTFELSRVYKSIKDGTYDENKIGFPDVKIKKADWKQTVIDRYTKEQNEAKAQYDQYSMIVTYYESSEEVIKNHLDLDTLTLADIEGVTSEKEDINSAKKFLLNIINNAGGLEQMISAKEYYGDKANYYYNSFYTPRVRLGIPTNDTSIKSYGNHSLIGGDASHGTHVAGIVAANRDNNIGIRGIADNAEIMVLRAVPNGDEYDIDIANAIRYAADNGAKIINCSFGKKYSPLLSYVKDAIKYAESKGVLIIKAAGNSGHNIDTEVHYPTDKLENNKTAYASNVITVGAHSKHNDLNITAVFSNYGKNNVDVFAPGVDVLSTTPDNHYKKFSGTSMASPAATGVAALLWSYFPELTMAQVKDILYKSAIDYSKVKVNLPSLSGDKVKQTKLGKISTTGGLVNAYAAVKMAMDMKQ